MGLLTICQQANFRIENCEHTLYKLHQPLFQRGPLLVSLLFLAGRLTSRHFSPWNSWEGRREGHSYVFLESVPLKTERALFGGWRSQALPPWEQQACCAPPLLLPHTTSSSILPAPLAIGRLSQCSRWISRPWQQTTLKPSDFSAWNIKLFVNALAAS